MRYLLVISVSVCWATLAGLGVSNLSAGVASMPQERPGISEKVGQGTAGEPKQIVSLSGWFTVVWNDRTRYFLTDDQGRWTELLLDEEMAKPLGGPLAFNRKRVKIVGERVDRPSGVIRVVSITFE